MIGETKIEPAMSAADWAYTLEELAASPPDANGKRYLAGMYEYVGATPRDNAEFIAANNAALPDGDPRKITSQDVEDLRWAATALVHYGLTRLAEKLASYLPPEGA